MHRRTLLTSMLGLIVSPGITRAHHGWASFDESKPIYLEGILRKIKWQNPHAEVVIELSGAPLPTNLSRLPSPKQQASVDAAAILARAVLPTRKDRLWEVEFAPLSRMDAWKFSEPKIGEKLAVVGYTFKDQKGPATLRVEFWLLNEQAIPLRSAPA